MLRGAQVSSMPGLLETRKSLISSSRMVVLTPVLWFPPTLLPSATLPSPTHPPPLHSLPHCHGEKAPSAVSQILTNSKLVWYETLVTSLKRQWYRISLYDCDLRFNTTFLVLISIYGIHIITYQITLFFCWHKIHLFHFSFVHSSSGSITQLHLQSCLILSLIFMCVASLLGMCFLE